MWAFTTSELNRIYLAGCHQHRDPRKLADSVWFDKLIMSGFPEPLVLSLPKDP